MNEITYVGKHTVIFVVSRHAHESWEFVYCTEGAGAFDFDGRILNYQEGDVVVIPPMVPHSNASEGGFRNIHLNMISPALSISSPMIITDDSNHFLLDAFNAAYFHYYSDRKEAASILSIYGDLICSYIAAYQVSTGLSPIVAQIENSIISNYADSDFELDAYLHSLPFSYDYLRKLFQKELGVTPHRYLMDRRLKLAAELLISDANPGARTIAEIAPLCGFQDPLYFSKLFKKKYGTAPRYYAESRAEKSPVRPDGDSMKIQLE